MSLFPKFKIPTDTPATLATPATIATFRPESSRNSESSNTLEEHGREAAIYYAEETPLLKNKTPKIIREIYKVKLAFPGCRVLQ